MTFAAVGGLIQSANNVTFSLTPAGVGDLILIEVLNQSGAVVSATALSSSNVTWVKMGTTVSGVTNAMTAVTVAGTVTAASAATVTITFSGATPAAFLVDGQEFSSTAGSWALDTQGGIDSAGTNTWASLTPAAAGELYFGYAFNAGVAVAGATSGYTYDIDAASNGMGFNPACTSAAQAPVWGDAGHQFGKMILVKETGAVGAVASPPPLRVPPGLQSPMVLAQPPRFAIPPAPQQRPAPAPQLIPPGLQSPMSLAEPARPATAAPPAPPPSPPMLVTPPGLQSPMALTVPSRPATQAPPPPPVPVVPGFTQRTPPGRLSPMSLGLGLYAPSPGPQVPPPVPPVTVTAAAPSRGDYDRNRLLRRRRYSLPRLELSPQLGRPLAVELATGWPGVWPSPSPVADVPEVQPEPEPAPPPRLPVYVRPPKRPRRYPDGMDAWKQR